MSESHPRSRARTSGDRCCIIMQSKPLVPLHLPRSKEREGEDKGGREGQTEKRENGKGKEGRGGKKGRGNGGEGEGRGKSIARVKRG